MYFLWQHNKRNNVQNSFFLSQENPTCPKTIGNQTFSWFKNHDSSNKKINCTACLLKRHLCETQREEGNVRQGETLKKKKKKKLNFAQMSAGEEEKTLTQCVRRAECRACSLGFLSRFSAKCTFMQLMIRFALFFVFFFGFFFWLRFIFHLGGN